MALRSCRRRKDGFAVVCLIVADASTLIPSMFKEDTPMRLSARNQLKGTVKSISHGAVNTEVVIALPGGSEIVSIITKSSAEALGLAVGKPAYAVVKASSVMVAVD